MAPGSTVFVFDIDLSDADRQVYKRLSLRVARHPSESDEFLVARVLAFCLEYQEGIEFSRGLCDADEPPIGVRNLTGALTDWIDVGTPSAERLHRASKLARRVVVYVHKGHRQWLQEIARTRIHRAAEIACIALDAGLIAAVVARLERRMSFPLTVVGAELFIAFADATVSGPATPLVPAGPNIE